MSVATEQEQFRFDLLMLGDDATLSPGVLMRVLSLHVPERPDSPNLFCAECSRHARSLTWWPCHVVRVAKTLDVDGRLADVWRAYERHPRFPD